METVAVSAKYQVVIPKSVRRPLGIKPGMRVQVLVYGDRIILLPLRSARDLRGFLKGMGSEIERDEDRV